MVIYIIDTYAWIEYLTGSAKGKTLKNLFEKSKDKFITMECCVAELKGFCLKNNIDFNRVYSMVKSSSFVFPVLLEHWTYAADIKSQMRKKFHDFGLIDSILIAKQKELKGVIITGDKHFKGLKNILYID